MVEFKDKKDKKKESTASEGLQIFEIIFGLLILFYFFYKLNSFLTSRVGSLNTNGTSGGSSFFSSIFPAIGHIFIVIFPTIELLSIFISVLLIMGIIYTYFRLHYVRKLEYAAKEYNKVNRQRAENNQINPKWQRVLKHVNSQNPADWRLAILEADILLGDLLEKMGYHGEGIGEMLKNIEKSDFTTLDNAWEAHKIRNAIAHEGADFLLSEREAKRAISLYQSVFEEFHST